MDPLPDATSTPAWSAKKNHAEEVAPVIGPEHAISDAEAEAEHDIEITISNTKAAAGPIFAGIKALEKKYNDYLENKETSPIYVSIKVYSKLQADIQTLKTQHWESKTWLQKIIAFFYADDTDKKIDRLSKQVLNERKRLESPKPFTLKKDIAADASNIDHAKPSSSTADIKSRLKAVYCRLVKTELPSTLEGNSHSSSISSLSTDIEGFSKLCEGINTAADAAIKLLHGVKEKLDFATEITNSANPVHLVQKKIEQLKTGEEMVIPGGYATDKGGHAVMYSIRRDSDNSFSFTVINTGEGSDIASSVISRLRSEFVDDTRDKVIKNVTKEQLEDDNFLKPLLVDFHKKTPDNMTAKGSKVHSNSMELIFKHLRERLATEGRTIEEGRRHPLQINGTCTHDSTCSWIESVLPPELFKAFEVYMAGSALNVLRTIEDEQPMDHTLSEIKGKFGFKSLEGKKLIVKIEQLGIALFNDLSKSLPKVGSHAEFRTMANEVHRLRTDFKKNKTEFEKYSRQGIRKLIAAKKQEKAALEAAVKQAYPGVDATLAISGTLSQNAARAERIDFLYIGITSPLIRQLKAVQNDLHKLEQRRLQLQNPAYQGMIEKKRADLMQGLRATKSSKENLEKKMAYLDNLRKLPSLVAGSFKLQSEK